MRGIDMRAGGRGGAVGAGAPSLGSELLPADGPIGRSLSRRTVVKGAAWSVPVLMFANAAPAFAASGPISAGRILESSCTISGDQGAGTIVRQTSMFIEGSDAVGAGDLVNVLWDLTITITYTPPPNDTSGVDFTRASIDEGSSWGIDRSQNVVTLTAAKIQGSTPNSGNWGNAIGFRISGYTLKLDYTVTDNYGRDLYVAAPVGSILVTAVARGVDTVSGQVYEASGLVMGEQSSMTAPWYVGDSLVPLHGPDFAVPNGNSGVTSPDFPSVHGVRGYAVMTGVDEPLSFGAANSPQLSVSYLDPSVPDGNYTALGGEPVAIATANGIRTVTFTDSTDAPWHFDADSGARDTAELAAVADAASQVKKPDTTTGQGSGANGGTGQGGGDAGGSLGTDGVGGGSGGTDAGSQGSDTGGNGGAGNANTDSTGEGQQAPTK